MGIGRPSRTGGLPPTHRFALSRSDAALFLTLTPREFDEAVRRGDFPGPRRICGLDRWLRDDLENAARCFPQDESSKKKSIYSDVA